MMFGVEVCIVLQFENKTVTPYIERLWVITVLCCCCSISQTVYILAVWSRRPCQYIVMPTRLLSCLIWVPALRFQPHSSDFVSCLNNRYLRYVFGMPSDTFTFISQYFCLLFTWRTRRLSWINGYAILPSVECPSAERPSFYHVVTLKCCKPDYDGSAAQSFWPSRPGDMSARSSA